MSHATARRRKGGEQGNRTWNAVLSSLFLCVFAPLRETLFRRGTFARLWKRFLSLQIGWVVLLAVAPLAAWGTTIRNADLIARQRVLQRAIVLPDVNAMLFDFDQRQGIQSGIVTDYLALSWLPGLERRFITCAPENAAAFQKIYRRPEIGFALLHRTRTSSETWRFLETSGEGKSRLIGQTPAYRFYQKITAEAKSPVVYQEIAAVAKSPILGADRFATAPGKR